MRDAVDGAAFWLRVGTSSVAAVTHRPCGAASGCGVLLLPPFGWEETAAHRGIRAWAHQLAAAGHVALRLDWPGTGDSSGSTPDRLEEWTQTVAVAAEQLRRVEGCERIIGLGLGLGGLVAVAACAQGAAVDDLALWAAPPDGRAALRQLKAAAALLAMGGAQRDDDGAMYVFGYPVPAALQTALTGLVIREEDLHRPGRRVLVLNAGGMRSLAGRFGGGVEVQVVAAPGYDGLVGHPQMSRLPEPVVAQVNAWISAADVARPQRSVGAPELPTTWCSDTGFVEELVEVPGPLGAVRAVVSRPQVPAANPLTVVLYNTGATRRTGPNRMWVDAARRWAEAGVAVVRFDLPGFGDSGDLGPSPSDTDAYYAEALRHQVRSVLDALPGLELPDRVVLAGLCSGAYSSWQLAAEDARVVGAVLLNPQILYALPWLMAGRATRDLRKVSSAHTWRKVITGRMELAQIAAVGQALAIQVRRRGAFVHERRQARQMLQRDLERLTARRVRVATVFVPGETLLLEMRATGTLAAFDQLPLLSVHMLDGPVDDHTLAAPALRAQADGILDGVVRELSVG